MNRDELYGTLLDLLDYTTPSPYEHGMLDDLLPKNGTVDDAGNLIVCTDEKSHTLFACHIDTVGTVIEATKPDYFQGYLYAGSKKAACLGGDDRCGILCLLALIEANVPGTYIFHAAEEIGLKGAMHIAKTTDLSSFDRAIEFDRRGTKSIISSMMSDPVCSQMFVNELADQIGLNFKDDPTGLITDVYMYSDMISEVTNLSVGYYDEHSNKECISVLWLIDQFIPSILKVKWEDLPAIRKPMPSVADMRSAYGNYFEPDRTSFKIDESMMEPTFEYATCDLCGNDDYLMKFNFNEYQVCNDCWDSLK